MGSVEGYCGGGLAVNGGGGGGGEGEGGEGGGRQGVRERWSV